MAAREKVIVEDVRLGDENVDENLDAEQAAEEIEDELVREIGTEIVGEAAVRSEIRKDGSIAYFSTEAAAATIGREIGSPTL